MNTNPIDELLYAEKTGLADTIRPYLLKLQHQPSNKILSVETLKAHVLWMNVQTPAYNNPEYTDRLKAKHEKQLRELITQVLLSLNYPGACSSLPEIIHQSVLIQLIQDNMLLSDILPTPDNSRNSDSESLSDITEYGAKTARFKLPRFGDSAYGTPEELMEALKVVLGQRANVYYKGRYVTFDDIINAVVHNTIYESIEEIYVSQIITLQNPTPEIHVPATILTGTDTDIVYALQMFERMTRRACEALECAVASIMTDDTEHVQNDWKGRYAALERDSETEIASLMHKLEALEAEHVKPDQTEDKIKTLTDDNNALKLKLEQALKKNAHYEAVISKDRNVSNKNTDRCIPDTPTVQNTATENKNTSDTPPHDSPYNIWGYKEKISRRIVETYINATYCSKETDVVPQTASAVIILTSLTQHAATYRAAEQAKRLGIPVVYVNGTNVASIDTAISLQASAKLKE